jgi:hypothetical protein
MSVEAKVYPYIKIFQAPFLEKEAPDIVLVSNDSAYLVNKKVKSSQSPNVERECLKAYRCGGTPQRVQSEPRRTEHTIGDIPCTPHSQVLCLYSSVLRTAIEDTEISSSYTHEGVTYPLIDLSDIVSPWGLSTALGFMHSTSRPFLRVTFKTDKRDAGVTIEPHLAIAAALGIEAYFEDVHNSVEAMLTELLNGDLFANRLEGGKCYYIKHIALIGNVLDLAIN